MRDFPVLMGCMFLLDVFLYKTKNFDLCPSGLIDNLELIKPIYLKTASYGHFGRENIGFKWEEVKNL